MAYFSSLSPQTSYHNNKSKVITLGSIIVIQYSCCMLPTNQTTLGTIIITI